MCYVYVDFVCVYLKGDVFYLFCDAYSFFVVRKLLNTHMTSYKETVCIKFIYLFKKKKFYQAVHHVQWQL